MRILFTAQGYHYPGLADALTCARRYSGCEVHLLADPRDFPEATEDINQFNGFWPWVLEHFRNESPNNPLDVEAKTVNRWFLVREWMRHHGLDEPVLCPDWDLLIFCDCRKELEPHLQFHAFGVDGMAALGISHYRGINHFCEYTRAQMADPGIPGPRASNSGDMCYWGRYRSQFGVSILDPLYRNGTWDNSMHLRSLYDPIAGAKIPEYYQSGDESLALDTDWGGHMIPKRVVFRDGLPHFVRSWDGHLIRANSVHCWGNYKLRTKEFIQP